VTPVPVAAGLHLKSSINIVAPDTLLATPDFAGRPEFAAYNILTVAPAEAYAGNTLHINGTLITPTGYPETLTLLKALELPVIELDTSEFRKLDGGLTCLSLRF
jgi:dimethylargininase